MSFVLIVEPEEVNASRIRNILDGAGTDFSYQLVTSVERGLDVLANQETDVFIGDMQMPIMSGEEFFSMVRMMSPKTICIAMTDARKIRETIAFTNQCEIFKLIIKPCRVVSDLLEPINAAFSLLKREAQEEWRQQKEAAERDAVSLRYENLLQEWKRTTSCYPELESVFGEMLACNLAHMEISEDFKRRVERWYRWMAEEYLRNILTGYGDYEMAAELLRQFANDPEHGFYFQMKKNTPEQIPPIRMNEITYLLKLLTGVSKDLLNACRIQVLIESAEQFYIIRILFAVERDEAGNVAQRMYRVKTLPLRAMLIRATKCGIAALGYKGTVIKRNGQDMLNLAVPKM